MSEYRLHTHTHTHTHIHPGPYTMGLIKMIIYKSEKNKYTLLLLKYSLFGDFPGGPVAKTVCSQCRGHGFHPWSVN